MSAHDPTCRRCGHSWEVHSVALLPGGSRFDALAQCAHDHCPCIGWWTADAGWLLPEGAPLPRYVAGLCNCTSEQEHYATNCCPPP